MQVKKLKLHLYKVLPEARWNFDIRDIDKILRVDSEGNIVLPIINLLNMHNYSCEELECKQSKKIM